MTSARVAISIARTTPAISSRIMAIINNGAQGHYLFLMNCARCHGDEGADLYILHKTNQRIRQLITNGVKGETPSFAKKKLNDSDIRALSVHLRTLRS
jgi:mono/diheme cytochrome c family protein